MLYYLVLWTTWLLSGPLVLKGRYDIEPQPASLPCKLKENGRIYRVLRAFLWGRVDGYCRAVCLQFKMSFLGHRFDYMSKR